MKYHITKKVKINGDTISRTLTDYNTEELLTCANLKALIKSELKEPFEVGKEILIVKNQEIKDENQIIENVSNIEYVIYYKK